MWHFPKSGHLKLEVLEVVATANVVPQPRQSSFTMQLPKAMSLEVEMLQEKPAANGAATASTEDR